MVFAFSYIIDIISINLGINEKRFTNTNFIQYTLDNDIFNNYNKKPNMNPTQIAQQIIANYQTPPGTIYNTPIKTKPIFVIRVPMTLTGPEIQNVKDAVYKELENEYHILFASTPLNDFQFEMYNADKIEIQKWNELVNRILK